MIRGRQNVHLFFEVEASRLFDAHRREFQKDVENATEEQLRAHETYYQKLLEKYQIEPLHLNFEGVYVSSREEQIPGESHPRFDFLVDHMKGKSFSRQVITFHLPYSGTFDLLRCIPNPRILSAPEVSVTDNEILFDIIDFYTDPDRVKREADQILDVIKKQSENLASNVEGYNTALPGQIKKTIEQRKEQLQKQSNVVGSLGYPVKPSEKVETEEQKGTIAPAPTSEFEWDVFISHASEDKGIFVRNLADELGKSIRVWYDEFTLKIGDSLRRSIDKGLGQSRYGVVVLSHNFFKKEWPQKELDGLVAMERDGRKVILPIWLDVDAAEITRYSPLLADRVAAKASDGLEQVVAKLLLVLIP